MDLVKRLALLVFAAALLTPIDADAQIGRRLKNRIVDRAKERVEENAEAKANELIDGSVDKAVDAVFARTEDKINAMIEASFSKNQADVDLENNVIRQSGKDDIRLTENATSPADAEYLQYLSVTTLNLPGGLSKFLGNGSYQTVYQHGDRRLERTATSATLTDLSKEHMAFLDYEAGTYWVQPFADFGAFVDEMAGSFQGYPGAGQQTASSDVKVDFSVEVREGRTGTVRGVDGKQHFVIVETKYEGEDEDSGDKFKGTLYTVSEVWTTQAIAGLKTMQDFGAKLMNIMGQAFAGTNTGQALQVNMMGDPRMGAGLQEAGKKLSELEGFAIQTETYMVSVPEGKSLDLDLVLAGGDANTEDWASSMSGESDGPKEQVTMFSSLTFVSNMSTDAFSDDVLDIPSDLKLTASPLEQMRKKMQEDDN